MSSEIRSIYYVVFINFTTYNRLKKKLSMADPGCPSDARRALLSRMKQAAKERAERSSSVLTASSSASRDQPRAQAL